ncbi:transient receptor potential cation channel subfamily A member 1 isoform X7 [Drosophila sulfurigaster albostrigata]|uniref:transient receptor potential cation channel subfamily A member 1 isoform X7 n=1 Tax=Drosophila sulfurigaster albostrigata TaxID=89887 RepID=UPI002D21A895|nr:transient receptor potential cation channel subfamily A member 1 isoform X7 [Drosophila sulfurigaster albostrigata]
MPKLFNSVYNAQCSALSPPDLMEAQPKLLPKTRSNSSSSTSQRNSKYWIFSMIIERSAGPKRVEIGGDDMDTPLEAILPAEPAAEQVCLLRDSPFRILRAAESGNLDDFKRLYIADTTRITLKDGKGRTAAHQAAARNRVNILRYICDQRGDFNAKDNAGNTPLHIAVECDAYEALDYLLSIPVDTGVLNEKKQAPVHLATELNKVKSLRVMGQYRSVIDIQQGGEHGRTALHLAAIYDHEECARILWGEQRGCTREEMISFYDSEGNVPLHSAVHGGDIKAVELCLKSGAKISTQQHDLSTPVHLACAQGAIEIVKLMFEMQPLEKRICLSCTDVQKMTPLHCASMFDHPDIVSYLVNEGAEINALDKEHRSPLLLAASRSGWKTVHLLIRLGASIDVKDAAARNVLHFVIMNGGRLTDFAEHVANCQTQQQLQLLLNEKDDMGCSPLHYASRDGHIRSLENLIRLGACINLKNNNNESPLHFAARYGRYNTVRQLLDSEKGSFIINESDGAGMTPLHIASQQGHTRVVQLLLNRGALLHRDHSGRNPLQLAAMSGYTETIELLHSVHSHLLDQVDKDGNTALHLATMENKPHAISVLMSMGCKLVYNVLDMSAIDYAIYYKYPEAALAMVTHEERANEVMALRSDKHPCVTLALIASMPRVFEAVQDKCITKANCKKDSKSFYIRYSFAFLQCPFMFAKIDEKTGEPIMTSNPIPLPALNIKYSFGPYQKTPKQIEEKRKEFNDPKWRPAPLSVVNTMVTHGRVELLAHPLSQKYLQMKWNSYGKYFHLANLLVYSIFLVFVTIYSSLMMNNIELRSNGNETTNKYCQGSWDELARNLSKDPLAAARLRRDSCVEHINRTNCILFCAVVIVVYILLNSVREFIQIYQQRLHYLVETVNIISWVLQISALIMVAPTFKPGGEITTVHYSAAAIAVFLSWFRLLLFLQRFDQVGIYVVMFLEILQTLIKVLMVFSILIIAFGLAFYILLSKIIDSQPNHLSFSNIPMSLLRTFSMMLGELDFVGTYVTTYYREQLKVPMTSFLILSVFMVLMPILLMNLLIGLAVGDIESVRRNAQLKRLAMQVVLHTELERKLPHVWLQRVDKMELIEYPNDTKCKLGFLDFILRKWFSNPFTDDSAMDAFGFDNNDDLVNAELERQRRKLRDISRMLEQQHQLVRLIVQKMEIKTEADDVDEGISPNELRSVVGLSSAGGNRWNSPRIRNKLRAALSFNKGM